MVFNKIYIYIFLSNIQWNKMRSYITSLVADVQLKLNTNLLKIEQTIYLSMEYNKKFTRVPIFHGNCFPLVQSFNGHCYPNSRHSVIIMIKSYCNRTIFGEWISKYRPLYSILEICNIECGISSKSDIPNMAFQAISGKKYSISGNLKQFRNMLFGISEIPEIPLKYPVYHVKYHRVFDLWNTTGVV